MTVNITCNVCDGRRLCEACRTAARTLSAAGYRVEHSTRYEALRAAASGTYGFDACVVPAESNERAVIEAAVSLLAGKRLAFVVDEATDVPPSAAAVAAVVPRSRYAAGEFSVAWLTEASAATGAVRDNQTAAFERASTADSVVDASDLANATRRLKRLADVTRRAVATAGLPSTPRLDLVAVLEDEVAWARASGVAFSIILVHLHGVSSTKASEQAAASEKRVRDAESIIARAVRSSDIVSGRGDDFLVALAEVGGAGVTLALHRIESALSAAGLQANAKQRRARGFAAWSIGSASFPEDGTTRDALLARATATLKPLSS